MELLNTSLFLKKCEAGQGGILYSYQHDSRSRGQTEMFPQGVLSPLFMVF